MSQILPFPNSTAVAQQPFKPDPGNGGMAGAAHLAAPPAGRNGGASMGGVYQNPFGAPQPNLVGQAQRVATQQQAGPGAPTRQGIDPNALSRQQREQDIQAAQGGSTAESAAQVTVPESTIIGRVKRFASNVPWWGWGVGAVVLYGGYRYYTGKPLVPFIGRRRKSKPSSDEE